jgi:hypothetical protein
MLAVNTGLLAVFTWLAHRTRQKIERQITQTARPRPSGK